MELMIAKWIRETKIEYEKAKANQNAFKMIQMIRLSEAFKDIRNNLS